MTKRIITSIQKHPLTWFYIISVLIAMAIIPMFYFSGANEGLKSALEKSGIPFKADLVTAFRVVLAASELLNFKYADKQAPNIPHTYNVSTITFPITHRRHT